MRSESQQMVAKTQMLRKATRERDGQDLRTTSSIKQPVSSLDGIVDGVGAGVVVDFPETEADLGHLVAIVQRDVGCVDHGCESVSVRECEAGRRRNGS
jgi:hypothetical protein